MPRSCMSQSSSSAVSRTFLVFDVVCLLRFCLSPSPSPSYRGHQHTSGMEEGGGQTRDAQRGVSDGKDRSRSKRQRSGV